MNWMDIAGNCLLVIIGLVVAGLLLCFLHWLGRLIFLEFHYEDEVTYKGTVTDMNYEPSKSYTTWNGTTSTTHYTSEKNVVYIKTELNEDSIDSSRLYQRCRIGDDVKITYQPRWCKPRFWEGPFKLDGHRLIRVECPKNQVVEFNSVKPISPNKRLVW